MRRDRLGGPPQIYATVAVAGSMHTLRRISSVSKIQGSMFNVRNSRFRPRALRGIQIRGCGGIWRGRNRSGRSTVYPSIVPEYGQAGRARQGAHLRLVIGERVQVVCGRCEHEPPLGTGKMHIHNAPDWFDSGRPVAV